MSSYSASHRLLRIGLLVVLVALPTCGRGDPRTLVGRNTRPEIDPDAVLVPLSGSNPAHVMGSVHFNRFHLLTTEDGFAGKENRGDPAPTKVPGVAVDARAQEQYEAGRYRSAARGFHAAADEARKARSPAVEEGALQRALACEALLNESVEMLDSLQRLLLLQTARRDSLATARTQADLGSVYGMLANYTRALDHLGAAAETFGRLGMRRRMAHARAGMGLVYLRRAEYGPALDALEDTSALLETTRDKERTAYVLGLLGNVHESVGELDRARELYEQALALHAAEEGAAEEGAAEEGAAEEGAADEGVDTGDVLGNLGNVHVALSENEEALDHYKQAQAIFEAHQDHAGKANTLYSTGRVRKIQGGYATALALYRAALELQEGDSPRAARTLGAMAETYLAMGRTEDALDEVEQAIEKIDAGVARAIQVELLVVHALASLRKQDPDRAVMQIRRALDVLMEVSAGLADEHVVGLREHSAWVFIAGLAVALKLDRVDLATEFLEHGRAGALLEGLGGRGARRGLSRELEEAEARSAFRLAAANRNYQSARAGRRMKDLRVADAALSAARATYRRLQQRIQREAKRVASVFHPVPDSLADIQAGLADGDVLVLYALLPFHAYALIVTSEGARVQWLGNTEDISRACRELRVDAPEDGGGTQAQVMERAGALRKLVIDPLALPEGTRRLLLSPDGSLCYVPFPLLLSDRDVAISCLPSGTTLRLLSGEQLRRGRGVLALGDPDYTLEHQGRSLQVYAEGTPLVALPATRAEVLGITEDDDVRLLGAHATVRNLTQLAGTRDRWSAIHLACHGLIDPRTPTLSALAVTPEDGDDGFLTALEVYGMHLPADLAVLSGCNTGRGRFVRGEGLVGLMRAFMCAGAPRIVVSLWKVDDEATQALMTRFHALWRKKRLPTSVALRRAQREIAQDPRWSHPRYWSAWVLWGLVD